MTYGQLNEDGTFKRILDLSELIQWDDTHRCVPLALNAEERILFKIVNIVETSQPFYDINTQRCVRGGVILENELWCYEWLITNKTQEELEEENNYRELYRVARLWNAAHEYEYKEISGSAIGLLTIGVLQAKPKCMAVQTWIQSIWTEYYIRKAGTSTDYDFSFCGPCPYSMPELIQELGY